MTKTVQISWTTSAFSKKEVVCLSCLFMGSSLCFRTFCKNISKLTADRLLIKIQAFDWLAYFVMLKLSHLVIGKDN